MWSYFFHCHKPIYANSPGAHYFFNVIQFSNYKIRCLANNEKNYDQLSYTIEP